VAFNKHISQYTAALSIQWEATGREPTDKGEGMSKGKGKERELARVVEEETLDAEGEEEVESGGEEEEMEEVG
jgi:hypothetical protein